MSDLWEKQSVKSTGRLTDPIPRALCFLEGVHIVMKRLGEYACPSIMARTCSSQIMLPRGALPVLSADGPEMAISGSVASYGTGGLGREVLQLLLECGPLRGFRRRLPFNCAHFGPRCSGPSILRRSGTRTSFCRAWGATMASGKRDGVPFPTQVIIFGAGGLGREVLAVFRALAATGQNVTCSGFVVDPEFAVETKVQDLPVYRGFSVLRENPECRIVVALGDPNRRRHAVQRIERLAGPRFTSAIHPAATIGVEVAIGTGTMVLGPASITTDVSIGRHVLLNPLVAVSHDCRLADYATLGPAVALAGGVEIEEGADLGVGAKVIPRQRIGAWSVVGAGATVIHPVAANSTVVGVPTRQIRLRDAGWHDAG
jgi:sugar O-acyltransferase (sialic acid O-acetyltransferase NeuD family)